ncbi:13006_t:CDS:2 [Entrophospora sp. SA101]|nr:13006_t:CDS:2 [Entrophospora sp. SA101]
MSYWAGTPPPGDGHYNKRHGCIEIATHSFSLPEVDLLRSILLDRYGIESTRPAYNKAKEQSILRIPKREVSKVQALVSKLIPNSTAYRVGLSSSSDGCRLRPDPTGWTTLRSDPTGSIEISTHSYTGSEVERLRAALLKNFNIESTRVSGGVKGKDQYRIRIPKREVAKVKDLVAAHLPCLRL